jgi:hypothetical protein
MGLACGVAVLMGLTVPGVQPLALSPATWNAVFGVWLLGPIVAGGILRSPRWLPALVPALVWYLMLPMSMLAGFMAPVDCPACGQFRPEVAVVYLIAGLPVFVGMAWVAAFVAGRTVRRVTGAR